MKVGLGRVLGMAVLLAAIGACTGDPEPATPPQGATGEPPSATESVSVRVGSDSYLDIATGERTPAGVSLYEAGLPEVSPNGESVVWFTFEDGITFSALDGSAETAIRPDGLNGYAATWVDDETILFQGRPTDGGENEVGDLYVADVSTGEATMVTDLPLENHGVWFIVSDVSPGGTTVLFHLPRKGKNAVWDLWTAPIEGGEATLLRKDAGLAQYGPDGSIVFLDHPVLFEGDAIWIMDGDGRHARPLVESGPYATVPRFSPDGTMVLYAEDEMAEIVDVASGKVTELNVSTHHSDPAWYDDETLLVD